MADIVQGILSSFGIVRVDESGPPLAVRNRRERKELIIDLLKRLNTESGRTERGGLPAIQKIPKADDSISSDRITRSNMDRLLAKPRHRELPGNSRHLTSGHGSIRLWSESSVTRNSDPLFGFFPRLSCQQHVLYALDMNLGFLHTLGVISFAPALVSLWPMLVIRFLRSSSILKETQRVSSISPIG